MSSLILAAPPVPGELTPILDLASDLVARSHEVLVVTTGEHEAAVRETGARFVSVGGVADTTNAAWEMLLEAEWAALEPGPAQLNFGLIHAFVDALPDQYATLQRLLAENPDRMLIANSLFLGASLRPPQPALPPRTRLRPDRPPRIRAALSNRHRTRRTRQHRHRHQPAVQ